MQRPPVIARLNKGAIEGAKIGVAIILFSNIMCYAPGIINVVANKVQSWRDRTNLYINMNVVRARNQQVLYIASRIVFDSLHALTTFGLMTTVSMAGYACIVRGRKAWHA